MPEFFRDPVWQFVGAALALIAVIIAVITRRKKSLSFAVITNEPIFTVSQEVKSRTRIAVDGVPVENGRLLVIGVLNDGNVPIAPTDFERPLTFSLGEADVVVSAEVSKKHPQSLKPEITSGSNFVGIKPLLMNPGDAFLLKLVVDQEKTILQPDVRVIGISDLGNLKERSVSTMRIDIALWGLGAGAIVFSMLTYPQFKWLSIVINVLLTLLLYRTLKYRWRRRQMKQIFGSWYKMPL
jgi:hypothetical protein